MASPFPIQASSFAHEIDFLIIFVAIVVGFWLLVAEGVLFYFVFKYRAKDGKKAQYITGEKKEEMKWIHLPHNLVLLCDVAILFFAVRVWYDIKQAQPPADETIRITGRQWSWIFTHPGADHKLGTADDVETVDELHVMVDKTYHFIVESKDVIHSFSVPVFRLKQDAIPGRSISGWFKPIITGTFDVQCTEICGIGHGIMKSRITIESEAEHQQWLASKNPAVAQK